MDAVIEKSADLRETKHNADVSSPRRFRVAHCPPELQPMQRAMRGEKADATYILQGYIAAGLMSRGHDLTFIAQRSLGQNMCGKDLQNPTLAPHSWSNSRWFDLTSKASWRIQQLLGVPYLNVFSNYRLFDACIQCLPGHDIVYERNGLYRNGVAMACKRLGLPYVLFVEADEILEHDIMGKPIIGMLRWRAKKLFRYNLHAADCIICVSEQLKHHLVAKWDVSKEKVVVFPNAVDVKQFRPYPEAQQEVRDSLNVGDRPMIIFVGNFYEWHDVATLLDAFAQVMAVHPEARLVLVGDGTQRQAMMHKAADLDISHAVQFTGFVSHSAIPRLMSAADVAVASYPALEQLWLSPLKLYEYMASGTLVVASAVGQIVDVVKEDHNGLLVPPGNASALAATLKKLIDDPALRDRLGRQAREDVMQKNSWDYYISRLERLFAAVIAGHSVASI